MLLLPFIVLFKHYTLAENGEKLISAQGGKSSNKYGLWKGREISVISICKDLKELTDVYDGCEKDEETS